MPKILNLFLFRLFQIVKSFNKKIQKPYWQSRRMQMPNFCSAQMLELQSTLSKALQIFDTQIYCLMAPNWKNPHNTRVRVGFICQAYNLYKAIKSRNKTDNMRDPCSTDGLN